MTSSALGQRAVELRTLELSMAGRAACSIASRAAFRAMPVAGSAHLAERELEVARAAEVADAQLLELVGGQAASIALRASRWSASASTRRLYRVTESRPRLPAEDPVAR